MMNTKWALAMASLLLLAGPKLALAQSQGIYTCVDNVGRKITSDRPISECMDREQKILNPSGSVKSILLPPKTAKELADLEAQKKKEAEAREQLEEERKRDLALTGRYPNKAVHDKTRTDALANVRQTREMIVTQVKELMAQRDKISAELEFYKKEPGAAPAPLRRRAEENTRNISEQRQLIAVQDQEIIRVNTRFDTELARLTPLWAKRAAPAQ
jgi:hypothetical protein